jgi:CDP-glycerol glycerophosphotransferase
MKSKVLLGDGDASLIKNALRLFLNQMLFVLSYIVPHRKGSILIGAGLGKRFMGNPKYLYLELLNQRRENPALDFFWITESKDILGEFTGKGWPVLDKFSVRGFWNLLRAEFLVIESGMVAREVLHDVAYAWLFFGRFNVIQTWHGSPMKRICLDALMDRGLDTWFERLFYNLIKAEYGSYECIVAQSEYDQKILSGAFSNRNVSIFGSARNDIFFDTVKAVEEFDCTLNLNSYTRVLLYAPTYREAKAPVLNSKIFSHRSQPLEPFSTAFLAQLNSELAQRNWVLLVKKHHLDKALKIQDELSHIVEVGQVDDIQELLVHADVLVTDYSSVCFDYLQAERPIIYYVYDLESYVYESRSFYIDYEKKVAGPFARNEHELLTLILGSDTWFYAEPYRSEFAGSRREFQKFSDGLATKRLLRYMRLRSSGYGVAEAAEATEASPAVDLLEAN